METLIEQMKTILGTTFGLYFKAHSYHWNVEGPDFAQYHDFLGNFYESVYGNVDTIAEHIHMNLKHEYARQSSQHCHIQIHRNFLRNHGIVQSQDPQHSNDMSVL